MKAEVTRRLSATGRLTGVNALGVENTSGPAHGSPGLGMVTGIEDHTRDETEAIIGAIETTREIARASAT